MQGTISDIVEENVVQPLLVSTSMIQLATETVRSIMKIDDIVRWWLIVNYFVNTPSHYVRWIVSGDKRDDHLYNKLLSNIVISMELYNNIEIWNTDSTFRISWCMTAGVVWVILNTSNWYGLLCAGRWEVILLTSTLLPCILLLE